jgi:PhnB protein
MASRLNPYLHFKDNAREAMEFYQGVFGGDLNANTFAEFGMEGPASDLIMHAQLDTPAGFTLMGSDTPPQMTYEGKPHGITISLSGDAGDELRGYWEKLAAGGTVEMPLEKQMWGDEYGQVTDKFGTSWMVNIGTPS